MLESILPMLGSAGGGAVLGLVGNAIQAGVEKKKLELQIEERKFDHELARAGAIKKHQKREFDKDGNVVEPPYYLPILFLTLSYCVAMLICFVFGDIIVWTRNPTADPIVRNYLWGLYSTTIPSGTVYVETFASVGAYMGHFVAFILSAVLTGIVPKKL